MFGDNSKAGSTDTPSFNLGDLFDLVADGVPGRTAVIWGEERVSYSELRERSDRLAAFMRRAGIRRGDTVGIMMQNSPVFLEALIACWKLGAISFTINYRYVASELAYILKDAEAAAIIQDEDYIAILDSVLLEIKALKLRMVIEAPERPVLERSDIVSYKKAIAEPVGNTDIHSGRSDADVMLIYTGGTTGLPKGVEWEHRALFFSALGGAGAFHPDGKITAPEQLRDRAIVGRSLIMFGAGPLMHGASVYMAFNTLYGGWTLVLMQSPSFDAELVWTLIEREKVNSVAIMGDAMMGPLVRAWDAHPGRWDVSSLFGIGSGGGALSTHNQAAIKERFPKVQLVNAIGSSESGTIGSGNMDTGGDGFLLIKPRADLGVIVDGERLAKPGEIGIFARTGHISRAYWRDPAKTAQTYVTIDSKRWILTGDRAKLEPNGEMRIYGRDSTSINTGGEKVFSEEVEAVVRSHPDVTDAVVIGVPHERWGQAVAVVLSLTQDAVVDLEGLRSFCAGKLARYKLPQALFVTDVIQRSPAGKADLRWAKAVVERARVEAAADRR
jgi:3-oxocholest-4-en-26-oate---CoA ligase